MFFSEISYVFKKNPIFPPRAIELLAKLGSPGAPGSGAATLGAAAGAGESLCAAEGLRRDVESGGATAFFKKPEGAIAIIWVNANVW